MQARGSSGSSSNANRYCDYVRRLERVSGLPSDLLSREILPLRDIPHAGDPRRELSLRNVIEIERSRNELTLVVLAKENELDYQRLLRRIVIPPSRSAPCIRALYIPNTRDPRRVKACKRAKFEAWNIGPPTLVENGTVPAEEETCPVLMIDSSDWPRTKRCWIELCPHECNVARSQIMGENPGYDVDLQVLADNNATDYFAEVESIRDSLEMEVVESKKSLFDMGKEDEPMLSLETNDLHFECLIDVSSIKYREERKFSDSEIIPLVKDEVTNTRPRANAELVDFIDLCVDDDDEDDVALKKELHDEHDQCSRIMSVKPLLHKKIPKFLEVVTINDDDDDDEITETTFVALPNNFLSESNCTKINEKKTVNINVTMPLEEIKAMGNSMTRFGSTKSSESKPVEPNLLKKEINDNDSVSNKCSAMDRQASFDTNVELEDNEKSKVQNKLILAKVADDNYCTANAAVTHDANKSFTISESVLVESHESRHFDNQQSVLFPISEFDNTLAPKSANVITESGNNIPKQVPTDFIIDSLEININSSLREMNGSEIFEKSTIDKKVIGDCKHKNKTVAKFMGEYTLSKNCSIDAQVFSKKVLQICNTVKECKNSFDFKDTNLQPIGVTTAENRKRKDIMAKNLALVTENNSESLSFLVAKRRKSNILSSIENCGIMCVEHLIKTAKQNKKKRKQQCLQAKELLKSQDQMISNLPEVLIKSLRHSYSISMSLSNYFWIYSFASSCLSFFSNYYKNVPVNKFVEIHNNILRNQSFGCNRYGCWSQGNHEVTIKNITETSNYALEKISNLPLKNKDYRRISNHNPWRENTFMELSDSFEHCLPKTVLGNDIKYKSEDLQINSIVDSRKVDLNYKQNLSKSAIPKNKYKEISSNSLNDWKFKKRHSLPTAVIPQPSCTKRSRTNSCDLPRYLERTAPITLTLYKDNSVCNYWSTSLNNKSTLDTCPEDNSNTPHFNEDKQSKEVSCKNKFFFARAGSSIKKSYDLDEKNSKLNSCIVKEVPELELNDYANQPLIINNNNLENALSPYLKSRLKRKSTDLSYNSNKRLKVPDKFFKEVKPKINKETNFIVQTTSESSLEIEKPLKLSYSKVLPKIHTSILNTSNVEANLDSENVHIPLILNSSISKNPLSNLDEGRLRNIKKNNDTPTDSKANSNSNKFSNDNLNNSNLMIVLPENSNTTINNPDKIEKEMKKSFNQIQKLGTERISPKNLFSLSEIDSKYFTPIKIDKLKKKFRILFEDSDTSEIEKQCELISVKISEDIVNVTNQKIIDSEVVQTCLAQSTLETINTLSKDSKPTEKESSNVNEHNFNYSHVEKNCEILKSKQIFGFELCKEKEFTKIDEKLTSTTKENEDIHLTVIDKNNDNLLSKYENVDSSLSIKNNVIKEGIVDFDSNNIKTQQIEEKMEVVSLNSAKELFNINESSNNFTSDKSKKLEQNKENQIILLNQNGFQTENEQNCNSINLPIKQITNDQVLPDSTQLDENLEGGDFDFLSSIHNTKHKSENSDDDYDMDSDHDVDYNESNTDCFINIKTDQQSEHCTDKSNRFEKCKNVDTSDLKELNVEKNAHYLEKLPSFYNECVTNVESNEESKDDDITILTYISSTSNTRINKIKCEKRLEPEIIDLELSNSATINSKSVEDINEEDKTRHSDTILETQNQKELNKCFDLQDYIITLCETSTDPRINESLALSESKLGSLSTEICDNEFSVDSSKVPLQTNNEAKSPLSITDNKSTSASLLVENDHITRINNELKSAYIENPEFVSQNQTSNKKLHNKMCQEMITKPVVLFTGNIEDDLKNSNILKQFNLIQESLEPEEIRLETSAILKINAEQQALCENLENIVNGITQENYNIIADSPTAIEKNLSLITTNNKSGNSIISSSFILEVKMPNIQVGSEGNYDLLKNINVHVVNEIDEVSKVNDLDETTFHKSLINSPSNNYYTTKKEISENCSTSFKLRNINELLENQKESSNQSSVKEISLPQSVAVSSTIRVDHQDICSTKTIANTSLAANIISFDSQIYNNVPKPQTIVSVSLTKTKDLVKSTSTKTEKLNLATNLITETVNAMPSSTIYSTSSPVVHSNLSANISQNNHFLSDGSSKISLSSKVNQEVFTYKLASAIFTDLFDNNDSLKSSKSNADNINVKTPAVKKQANILTMDLPPLETLSLPSPFTMNLNDPELRNSQKVREYKKILLKKIMLSLEFVNEGLLTKQVMHSLVLMTTLTMDAWKLQLNIITIMQCIVKLSIFVKNKSNDHPIVATLNAINSTLNTFQSSTLNKVVRLYNILKKKGLISSTAENMEPLYEELYNLNHKQKASNYNINNFMSIDQKVQLNTQVQAYSDIYNVNIDQCKLQQEQGLTANSLANSNKKISLRHVQKTPQTATYKEIKQKKSNKSSKVLISMSSSNFPNELDEKDSDNDSNNKKSIEKDNVDYNSLCLKCNEESMIVCGNCEIAAYCSRACQQDHWTKVHYKMCKTKDYK